VNSFIKIPTKWLSIWAKAAVLTTFYVFLILDGLEKVHVDNYFSWKLGNYADSLWFSYCEKVIYSQSNILK